MNVTYLNSASVLIEHDGVKVLCDPWLTGTAYEGSWYSYPPLDFDIEGEFADIDAIYISHIHPDHLHVETLKRLPKVPVYIATYHDGVVRGILEGLGFHVFELVGRATIQGNRYFHLQIIPADDCDPEACGAWFGCVPPETDGRTTTQIDTMAVFSGGGKVVVNTNDCPYPLAHKTVERIKGEYGDIDFLLTGWTGAGPWPQCFPDERTEANAISKKLKFIRRAWSFIWHLDPKHFMPFAGAHYLGGRFVDLNEWRGVPHHEEALDYFGGHPGCVLLNRRGTFHVERGVVDEPYTPQDPEARDEWLESLRSRPMDYDGDTWTDNGIQELVKKASAGWGLDTDLVAKPFWALNGIEIVTEEGTVSIDVASALLQRILTQRSHFNVAEIGSHLEIRRDPQTYDRKLWRALWDFHV